MSLRVSIERTRRRTGHLLRLAPGLPSRFPRATLLAALWLGLLLPALAQSPSPVVALDFDHIVDGLVQDGSGHGHHGLLRGGSLVPGIIGQALELDGKRAFVRIPHAPDLIPGPTFTLVFWLKHPADGPDYGRIVEGGGVFLIYLEATGSLRYGHSSLPAGSWHQIALTRSNGVSRVYIDGVLDRSRSNLYFGEGSTPDIYIGCRAGENTFFKGWIDEFRLYREALDAAELARLHAGDLASVRAEAAFPGANDDRYRVLHDTPLLVPAEERVTPAVALAEGMPAGLAQTIDGNESSYWQAVTETITFDLGTIRPVSGIRQTAGIFPGNPFSLELSTDNLSFVPVAEGSLTTGTFGEHRFFPRPARFLRLHVRTTAATGYGELSEFQALVPSGLLANDHSPTHSGITAVLVDLPAYGSVDVLPEGGFQYRPPSGFHGRDTFTYQAVDTLGRSSAPAAVTLEVEPAPPGPVATDDAYAVDSGTEIRIAPPGLLANDVRVDGGSIFVTSLPEHGTLRVGKDGGFSYVANIPFPGHDSFAYRLNPAPPLVWKPLMPGTLPGPPSLLLLSPGFPNDPAAFFTVHRPDGGLYRSLDAGRSWMPAAYTQTAFAMPNPTGPGWWGMSTDFDSRSRRGTLLVLANNYLYRSLDSGSTWRSNRLQYTDPIRTAAMSSAFTRDGILFLVPAYGQGDILRSTDGGITFSSFRTGPDPGLNCLAISPAFDVDGTLLLGGNNFGVRRSVTRGESWDAVSEGQIGGAIAFVGFSPDFAADGTVFAGPWAGGMARSQDRGSTWETVLDKERRTTLRDIAFSPDYSRDRTLVALLDNDFSLSEDGGSSWRPLASFGFAGSPVRIQLARSSAGGLLLFAIGTGPGSLSGNVWTAELPLRPAPSNAATVNLHIGSSRNTAPSLDPIPDLTLDEDSGPVAVLIAGIASGEASGGQRLTVSAWSENPGLLPNPVIAYASPATSGVLTLRPSADQHGSTHLHVTVEDDGGTTGGGQNSITREFVVIVRPLNDPPAISSLADLTVPHASSTPVLDFTVDDPETPAALLAVAAYSSDPSLVPVTALALGGAGDRRTLTATPSPGRSGTTRLSLTVRDPEGGATTASFQLTVLPATVPPSVRVSSPVALATFDPDATGSPPTTDLELAADVTPGSAPLARVDFLVDDRLIASADTPPYRVRWPNVPPGDYRIVARAIDQASFAADSAPVPVSVSDPTPDVAILRSDEDPEIQRLRAYLAEMGMGSRVLDSRALEGHTPNYRLVIHAGLNRGGIADSAVAFLTRARARHVPTYLVGDHLLSDTLALSPARLLDWLELLHLLPTAGAPVSDTVRLAAVSEAPVPSDSPASSLNGSYGTVRDYPLPEPVDPASLSPGDGVPLGTASGSVVLLAWPGNDEPAGAEPRSFTQLGRVWTGVDDSPARQRKVLFQNVTCWLTACSPCTTLDLRLSLDEPPPSVPVGSEFTSRLVVRHSGECPAAGVVVRSPIPSGVRVLHALSDHGAIQVTPSEIVFSLGTLASTEEATMQITLVPTVPGALTLCATVRADNPRPDANDAACLTTNAEGEPAPRLEISRDRTNIRIDLSTTAPGWVFESSTAVGPSAVWIPVPDAPATEPGHHAHFLPSPGQTRFFRLRR